MKKTLLLPLFLISIALWLANCTQSGPCTGSLTLENPIPDITVAVGDTVLIDLTNPPVFVSTEGRVSYSLDQLSGYIAISTSITYSLYGENPLLRIEGLDSGDAIIELRASSECLENHTTIKITSREQ